MIDTRPIDERLSLLSHIAYPAWVRQLNLVSQLDMASMQSNLARIVSGFQDPAVVGGMAEILSATEQVSSLLSGIVNGLPPYETLRALHDVNAESLLSQLGRVNSILTAVIPSALAGFERIDWAAILAQPRLMHDLLQAMPKEGLRSSFLAEAMLSRFDLSGLGSRFVGAPESARELTAAHVGLLSAYTVLSDATWCPSELGDQLRQVAEYPSQSLLLHADVVERISVVEPSETLAVERKEHVEHVRSSEDLALPDLLNAIDPRLLPLLVGAEDALANEGSDWLRHFSISSRELATHVLHTLAPDDDVRAWTSDATYYCAGRPTRRARTDFILRRVSSAQSRAYVDAVFQAFLTELDLLNEGTHALTAEEVEALAGSLLGQLKVSLATMVRVAKMQH
jgi:hypothetical protein